MGSEHHRGRQATRLTRNPAAKGGRQMTLIGIRTCRRVTRLVLRVSLLAAVLLAGLLPGALPSGSVVSAQAPGLFRGEYYNNTTLSGSPVLVRDDSAVNFDWGTGSPGSGVNRDNFSARWTGFVHLGAGTHTFHVTTDDGARLWVNDQLIIDQWRPQVTTTYSASRNLSAGYHSIRLEYYEGQGNAVIRLRWEAGTGDAITEWRGEYYNNTSLSGSPALVRNDSAINFDWGTGSPASGVNSDNFSARWTRSVHFPTSGTYVFSATADDGVRVWVDSVLVIDRWILQARTTHTGSIYLAAGAHQVKVEYFEATGQAVCVVNWALSDGVTPPVPTQEIIVDNRSSGFIWGGPAGSWYRRNVGYGGQLNWTWNGSTQVHNWAKWFPYVPVAGNWEVYVYIASRYFGSRQAKYQVYHSGTRADRVINQDIYSNKWVSLGTFPFGGGSNEYVYLGDNTGEPYATRYIGFDAVKFVRRDGGVVPPPLGCAITPVLGFGRVWSTQRNVSSRLGCPTATEVSIWAAEQLFQGGYMFWRDDTDTIYVIYNNGTWQSFADTWAPGEPESDPAVVPPSGLFQPRRGFGKVWRNNPAVRSTLGWALREERGFHGAAQSFNGGTMLWSNVRGIHVLYNDGRWERYN